jgi:hypothetical protein
MHDSICAPMAVGQSMDHARIPSAVDKRLLFGLGERQQGLGRLSVKGAGHRCEIERAERLEQIFQRACRDPSEPISRSIIPVM